MQLATVNADKQAISFEARPCIDEEITSRSYTIKHTTGELSEHKSVKVFH